jgi:hypothetical protein
MKEQILEVLMGIVIFVVVGIMLFVAAVIG